jgi:serine/threonine protein kinase
MIEKIGRYRILEEAGIGGMSTVYKAVDETLGRDVALKLLPAGLSEDEEFLNRFQREARLVAQLEHPNIVSLYDFGTHDTGQPYLVMRYLGGGDLSDRLNERRYIGHEHDFWAVIGQIGKGLTAAHAKNIIHRDLKPSNILFDDHGVAFIADFGIAKNTEQASRRITKAHTILGTVYYMSPEQCNGGDTLSAASDQYSLAVIVFEALTGNLPFDGDTLQVMGKHLSEPVALELLSNYSKHVIEAMGKALAKYPEDRFESVELFIEALTKEPPRVKQSNSKSQQSNPKTDRKEALVRDYAKAVQALDKKSFTEAIRLLDKVIRKDPRYKDATKLRRRAAKAHEQRIAPINSTKPKSSRSNQRKSQERKSQSVKRISKSYSTERPEKSEKSFSRLLKYFLIGVVLMVLACIMAILIPLIMSLFGTTHTEVFENINTTLSDESHEIISIREEKELSVIDVNEQIDLQGYGTGVITLDASADVTYIDIERIKLNEGSLVVDTQGRPIVASSKFGDQAHIKSNSQAGISYLDNQFDVHCFIGSCELVGLVGNELLKLEGHQKGSIGASGKAGPLQVAQSELFSFAPNVATPTPTPRPTNTPSATNTPLPTSTLPPFNTPVPTNIPALTTPSTLPTVDPNDPDGDGVLEYDFCPLEPGAAHNCGCPEQPTNCGGGDDRNDETDRSANG